MEKTAMAIETIGIVGAGTMGNGIAQAFAVAGHAVTLTDIGQPLRVEMVEAGYLSRKSGRGFSTYA